MIVARTKRIDTPGADPNQRIRKTKKNWITGTMGLAVPRTGVIGTVERKTTRMVDQKWTIST